MRRESFDEIDRRIIAHLQQDGRRPFTTIARDIGISEAGVRQRVARLVRRKVIQIVAASDPLGLGLHLGRGAAALRRRPSAGRRRADRRVSGSRLRGPGGRSVGHHRRHRVQRHATSCTRSSANRIRPLPGVQQLAFQLVLKVLKDTYQWSPAPPPDLP